jgi:hypothetical protein
MGTTRGACGTAAMGRYQARPGGAYPVASPGPSQGVVDPDHPGTGGRRSGIQEAVKAAHDDLAYLRYAWGEVYEVRLTRLWTVCAQWLNATLSRRRRQTSRLGKIRRDYPVSIIYREDSSN